MSLEEADAGRLRDVIAYGHKVAQIIAGASLAEFIADQKTFFAACYGIQVVGEAAWSCRMASSAGIRPSPGR